MTARESVTAYISLGANLGDPVTAVKRALSDLHHLPLTRVTAASDLYQSAPHETQGPDFINAVAALTTALSAPDLLLHLQGLDGGGNGLGVLVQPKLHGLEFLDALFQLLRVQGGRDPRTGAHARCSALGLQVF